jgi:hypothetical protein
MAKSLPLTENFYQKRKKTLATHHSIFDFGRSALSSATLYAQGRTALGRLICKIKMVTALYLIKGPSNRRILILGYLIIRTL